jgi:hypothetical protein
MRRLMAALLALAAVPAGADGIYQWVDELGRVHFGDQPSTPQAREVQAPRAPLRDPDSAERLERQRRLLEAFATERQAEAEQAAKAREEASERATRCAWAREEMRGLERAGRVFDLDPEGNRRYLDDAARGAALVRAREAADHWCR